MIICIAEFEVKDIHKMANKIIFFDIDGTLINFGGDFPESAKEALRLAKANGHKIFLCTGRSKCQIEDRLLEFGFDGFVSGAGAYVEYHDKDVFSNYMTESQLSCLIDYLDSNDMIYLLQSTDSVISTQHCADTVLANFKKNLKGDVPKNIKQIFSKQTIVDSIKDYCKDYTTIEKACYYNANLSLEEITEQLKAEYDVTAMSFNDVRDSSGEITVKGVTKALGMEKIVEFLGMSQEDTVAFGDGPNDFEMIEYAGVGVAMGNASDDLKAIADMVTTHIAEDGIYNGLKKLNLI